MIFTLIYNSFLIFFIAAHLLVGALISFGVGVYSGIYLSQNYEIPRINEPSKLWERFIKFTDQYRKPKKSNTNKSADRVSILSILTVNTEDESISSDLANRLSTTESDLDTGETIATTNANETTATEHIHTD